MSENNIPSAARLSRIETCLTGEPAFKGKLGKKSVTVIKRDGSKVHYCQEVVNVGIAIATDGKDAVTLSKSEVLSYAQTVINGQVAGSEAPAKEAPAPETTPAPEDGTTPAPEISESSSDSMKINYGVPCLSLVVGAKQMAELMGDRDANKLEKLVKLLSDAQALASELQ
jgi:hypothetical protein